MYTMFVDISCY